MSASDSPCSAGLTKLLVLRVKAFATTVCTSMGISSLLWRLPASCQRRRLRLFQPEPHAHLPVHRRRNGEAFPRLLTLAHAPIELSEAEVAVAGERAGTKRRSLFESCDVAALGNLPISGRHGNLTEDGVSNRLIPILPALSG